MSKLQRQVEFDDHGQVVAVKRAQYIDESELKRMQEQREKTSWAGEETLRVASVPLALVESLRQQGIDLLQLDHKELVSMLKLLGYERFLTYGGSL